MDDGGEVVARELLRIYRQGRYYKWTFLHVGWARIQEHVLIGRHDQLFSVQLGQVYQASVINSLISRIIYIYICPLGCYF